VKHLLFVALPLLAPLAGSCTDDKADESGGLVPDPTIDVLTVDVDASTDVAALHPLWRDHYDLSYEHFDYAVEAGFPELVAELAPRSWRCSVGRWEVGFPPPPGGDSLDPGELQALEREYYRGANTLAEADDPANYDFTYLDAQLAGLLAIGAEPFLCFDSMPFTLSAEQDPRNPYNFNLIEPGVPYSQYSFSNGIRTAPPADPAIYARVVRNAVRHVRGLFAGTTDFGVVYVEIGNEPDVVNLSGAPIGIFWTGDSDAFHATYAAIAAEIDADPELNASVRLGGGSFAFQANEPQPSFLARFLEDVSAAGTRLDFLSFHSYGDQLEEHGARVLAASILASGFGLAPELVNAEWGRALDGLDPVYDTIEHGIFRAQVLGLFEVFGVTHAHESLFRNPGTQAGELGLVKTGPPAHKPVSRCYQILGKLDPTPRALDVLATPGLIALGGRDVAGTRVALACVVQDPAANHVSRLEIAIDDLPFGAASFDLTLSKVDQGSTALGVEVLLETSSTGPSFAATHDVLPGEGGIYVWELVSF
jgi:hypothetical protein